MATIDSLQIDISTNAQSASDGINRLAKTLSTLGRATSKGMNGLGGIANNIRNLNSAVNSINGGAAAKVNSLITALGSLKSIGTLSNVKTVANNLGSINTALSTLNTANTGAITALANSLSSLSNLQNTKISGTIAKQITEIGAAAEMVKDVDLTSITNIATALQGFGTLGRATNFGSTLKQIERLPEIMSKLDPAQVETFAKEIDTLAASLGRLASTAQPAVDSLKQVTPAMNNYSGATDKMGNSSIAANVKTLTLIESIKAVGKAFKTAERFVSSWINESNEYIESMNLFTVSMGQYAEQAEEYAERVSGLVGIDPSVWKRNQGVFMTLTTGFGVASDRAYVMSQQLTQLGYDLSSFFNITVEDAMQKLQSGISGELEPLRRLGYDLSQARLQAIALSLGIDKAYNSMTQAEKGQLRYYAIMTQVTTAQGDMARTLDQPANQLRVLKAALTQAARAAGNIFIPALNAILPVAIAVVNAIRMVANALAGIFGFVLPGVEYSSGIDDVTSSVDDLDDSLSGAGGSAKKLKNTLMGFDELNVLNDQSSGGGGGGASGLDTGDMWNWDLPVYDFLAGLVDSKASAILNKWKPVINWFIERIEFFWALAEGIGAALLMWTFSKNYLMQLQQVVNAMQFLHGFTIGAFAIVVTYELANAYMDTGNIGYLLSEALVSGLGAAMTGSMIAKAMGAKAGGFAFSIVLGVSAIMQLVSVAMDMHENGVDLGRDIPQMILSVMSFTGAGMKIGAMFGSPWIGAAIGAAIGLALSIGTLVFVGLAHKTTNGTIRLTQEEIENYVNGLVDQNIATDLTLYVNGVEKARNFEETFQEKVNDLFATGERVMLNITATGELSETDFTDLKGDIDDAVNAFKEAANERLSNLALSFNVFGSAFGGTSNGEAATGALARANATTVSTIEEAARSLGEAMSAAFEEGATPDYDAVMEEYKKFAELMQEYENNQRLAQAQQVATSSSWSGELWELDYESLTGLTEELQTYLSDTYSSMLQGGKDFEVQYRTEMLNLITSIGTMTEGTEEYSTAMADLQTMIAEFGELGGFDLSDYDLSSMSLFDLKDLLGQMTFDTESFIARDYAELTEPVRQKLLEVAGYLYDTLDYGSYEEYTPGAAQIGGDVGMYMRDLKASIDGQMKELGDVYGLDLSDTGLNAWDLSENLNQFLLDLYADLLSNYPEDEVRRMFSEYMGIDVTDLLGDALGQKNKPLTSSNKSPFGDYFEEVGEKAGEDLSSGVTAKTDPLKDGISDAIEDGAETGTNAFISAVDGAINTAKRKFNGARLNLQIGVGLRALSGNITITDVRNNDQQRLRIQEYATGGMPKQGTMFVAGEAGSEIVGRIGRKSGVMNNDQISDLVGREMEAKGYGSGGVSEERLARAVASAISGMELRVDGESFGRVAIKTINGVQRRSGRVELVL